MATLTYFDIITCFARGLNWVKRMKTLTSVAENVGLQVKLI